MHAEDDVTDGIGQLGGPESPALGSTPDMATDPPPDLELAPLTGEPRTVAAWVTLFNLAVVVLDPYTYESAWLLDESGRILNDYTAADVRVGWVVTASPEETKQFLGPWADELLTFADPDRAFVKGLGLTSLPAFVHINMAGKAEAVAEGWDPAGWRKVAANLSRVLDWTQPVIPGPKAPAPYAGSPAGG
jgi:hypothetical protein